MSHKALLIVAARYNPLETFGVLNELIEAGFDYKVISSTNPVEDENTGEILQINGTLDEFSLDEIDDFDGVFFISGGPRETFSYWIDPRIREIVEKFNSQHKMIAAICCSVPSIRYALSGKRATCYPLISEKRYLEEAGAEYTGTSLMVDDNIVTAESQIATVWWARAAINIMLGKSADNHMKDTFESMTMTYGKYWRRDLKRGKLHKIDV